MARGAGIEKSRQSSSRRPSSALSSHHAPQANRRSLRPSSAGLRRRVVGSKYTRVYSRMDGVSKHQGDKIHTKKKRHPKSASQFSQVGVRPATLRTTTIPGNHHQENSDRVSVPKARATKGPTPSTDLVERLKSYGIENASFDRVEDDHSTPFGSMNVGPRLYLNGQDPSEDMESQVVRTPDGSLQYYGARSPRLREASREEMLKCLQTWLHEDDTKRFQSFAVYCEYKLRRSVAQASDWVSPNQFEVVVAWVCLMQCAVSMPHYSGLMKLLAHNLGGSIFSDFEAVMAKATGDGCENDAWLFMCGAETHFTRSRKLEVMSRELHGALLSLMEALARAQDNLAGKSMFSALGLLSDAVSHAIHHARSVISQKYGNGINKNSKDNDEDVTKDVDAGDELSGDALAEVAAITQMDSCVIQNLVSDIASHRNDFSTSTLLSNLFSSTSTKERRLFVVDLWKILHRSERDTLVSSIPLYARDGEMRANLKSILSEHGLLPADEDGEHSKAKLSDHSLLGAINQACRAVKKSSGKKTKEFLITMMGALGMLKVGEHNMNAESFELPRDPQGMIESRAREVARLLNVARDQIDSMRDDLENAHKELSETKASIRNMAKIQARLNDYKESTGVISYVSQNSAGPPSSNLDSQDTSDVATVEWPILNVTNCPNHHSLKCLIDKYYEEQVLRSNVRPNNMQPHGLIPVEELRNEIAGIYNQALLLGSQNSYSLAQIMKLHFLSEYGAEDLAVEHCRRIDYAVQTHHQNDARCHLFGVASGIIHPCSFLCRPETLNFIVIMLAHMIEKQVMGSTVTCVQDLFQQQDSEGTSSSASPAGLQVDRAETVVKCIFGLDSEADSIVSLAFVLKFISFFCFVF